MMLRNQKKNLKKQSQMMINLKLKKMEHMKMKIQIMKTKEKKAKMLNKKRRFNNQNHSDYFIDTLIFKNSI